MDVGDLSELLPNWRRHLRAANRAASTVRRYEKDARAFFAFLAEHGMPTRADSITREHLEHFLADEQSRPRRRRRGEAATLSPATVAGTYRSLQQLWRWLVDEGEATTNPFDRTKPPHVPEQPVPVLSDGQLAALLAACKGTEFTERRDTALVRLLLDTGILSAGSALHPWDDRDPAGPTGPARIGHRPTDRRAGDRAVPVMPVMPLSSF